MKSYRGGVRYALPMNSGALDLYVGGYAIAVRLQNAYFDI
jgi:hypothetical protein